MRQNFYSVPVRYAGRRMDVRLGAEHVRVLDGATVVAHHPRAQGKGAQVLDLDHYLEVLAVKPGALLGATALVAARRSGAFSAVHQRFWEAARRKLGDAEGTRDLIGVLLLHRTLAAELVVCGMERALATGTVDPEVVAVEARAGASRPEATAVADPRLAAFDRPAPSLTHYDDLLGVG